jgi:hypothetical protein
VRQIMRAVEPTDYRWSAIIGEIVKSSPFQMRRAADRVNEAPNPVKTVSNPSAPTTRRSQ